MSDVGSLGEGKGWAVVTLTGDHPPKVGTPRAREDGGGARTNVYSPPVGLRTPL